MTVPLEFEIWGLGCSRDYEGVKLKLYEMYTGLKQLENTEAEVGEAATECSQLKVPVWDR